MSQDIEALGKSYSDLLQTLKKEISTARIKAHLAVNSELILLYWRIGQAILARQKSEGWGAKVIDQLSHDLKFEFRNMRGFSPRNLKYMRLFAEEYPQKEFVQQVAAQLPWFHHCVLLDKLRDPSERLWYIQKAIENGWSRNVMVHHIEAQLHKRQGKAMTNFKNTLPAADSDLAQELFKSSYNLEFLDVEQHLKERGLEQALVSNIRDFLLELGTGFAFMGNQYKVVLEDEEFFIDMLFYNTRLRCYVVIELKVVKFLPEYAGNQNMRASWVFT
jgi:predicted nuclease of restriction endonuclease-like (RecB) superfamily